MNIDGVKTGIVLDHIQAGNSMEIYSLLQLEKLDCSVAIIQNVVSRKYGKKDIIKIDSMIDLDLDILGFIDPNITVNKVVDVVLSSKDHLQLPKELVNVIKCQNPRCITSVEREIPHVFYLADETSGKYLCKYCDVESKHNR